MSAFYLPIKYFLHKQRDEIPTQRIWCSKMSALEKYEKNGMLGLITHNVIFMVHIDNSIRTRLCGDRNILLQQII
jgi:hypothetical protein